MGLYFAVFSAVFIVACLKILLEKDKYISVYPFMLYIVMTAMLCLRFGQGTDYFAYQTIFESMTSFSNIREYYHGEPLYLFLCFVFNHIGNYKFFIAVISLAEMVMLWGFIRRRSVNKAVSVMLLMTVMYVTYLFNLMRQGLSMSIFLRFGLELIEKRRWTKYFALCFVLVMLHSVSAIYFLVPFVLKFNVRSIVWSIPVCAIISTVILRKWGGGIIPYFNSDIRFVAAAERILSFTMIYIVYSLIREKQKYLWLMKLYCFGTALYFMFLPFSLVASRTAACFKMLEIIIVPSLMTEHSIYRKIFMYYFFMLAAVMFSHGIYGEINNGHYVRSVNFVNFPYVSIFNAEDIYNYRQIK